MINPGCGSAAWAMGAAMVAKAPRQMPKFLMDDPVAIGDKMREIMQKEGRVVPEFLTRDDKSTSSGYSGY
jgi:hypothetical protein